MKTKYYFSLIIFLFLLIVCTSFASAEDKVVWSFGSAPVGSGAYVVSSGQTQLFNEKIEGLEIVLEVTSGGMDNLNLFSLNEIDIGIAGPNQIYEAYSGIGLFKNRKIEYLRTFIPLYWGIFLNVTLADSEINSIEDFRGKNISVGLKGSGNETHCKNIYEVLGLTYDDFDEFYLGYSETNDALKTGDINAAAIATGSPVPALLELEVTHPIKIIPFTKEQMEKINEKYPYYMPGTLPGGTYKGQDETVPTINQLVSVWLHKDIPEDLVYKMTKVFWENTEFMESFHASQKQLNAETMVKAMVKLAPLHPGAAKYYKEIGVLK